MVAQRGEKTDGQKVENKQAHPESVILQLVLFLLSQADALNGRHSQYHPAESRLPSTIDKQKLFSKIEIQQETYINFRMRIRINQFCNF